MKARTRAATILLTPFFLLFTAVMVVPIGYAVWLSLFTEKQSGLGFGGTETVFTGLDNYTAALGDRAFREGFGVLLGYCLFYIPLLLAGPSASPSCSTRRSPAPAASSSSHCSCRTPSPASSPP